MSEEAQPPTDVECRHSLLDRTVCFQCYRAKRDLHRAGGPESSPQPVSPFRTGVVRHFQPRVDPAAASDDPKYAALAIRRRQAQIMARRALAESAVDLDRYPESWWPFVRVGGC
jgi:hypothetical protein